MTTTLLEASQLRIARDSVPIVDDVTLAFHAGECVGLIGPNGAGKSTLLAALAGLTRVDSGEVRVMGEPLHAHALPRRASRIAYLEQQGECAWPIDVEHVVALGRLPHRGTPAALDDRAAVTRALKATRLTELSQRPFDSLSGGEKARTLLARALAVEAPILLVDEPIAELDPGHAQRMMQLLRARAASGVLVVVVLHDLSLALSACTRLVLMHGGRIVDDGAPEAVLANERIASAFGARPRTVTLEDGARGVLWDNIGAE